MNYCANIHHDSSVSAKIEPIPILTITICMELRLFR